MGTGVPRIATTAAFSAGDSLTLLVTTETLMFAALTIAVTLSQPVAGGRNMSRENVWRLVAAVTVTITVVAAAAALAWWQTFAQPWSSSWLRGVESAGILVGVIAEVVIAIAVARAVRP